MFKAPIAIGLSPNTQTDDVLRALGTILKPWLWKNGLAIKSVKEWFKKYFGFQEIYLFDSGRSALFLVLQSFGIEKGDEVLLQAFTCVAVPDPVIWVGAKPVFIDVDETLNIDPNQLEKHITAKTKAIIVQHTFGIPAKMELIKKIAQKYNLILVEDCAHSIGAKINGQNIGTFGDAAIFSFGRDKVISSVFGGMATINSKFKIQNSKLKELYNNLNYPGYFWIFQQLLHPIAMSVILPIYNCYLGKLLLFILQKLKLLSKPVEQEELKGEKPALIPALYPNGLAMLLLLQLNKLETYNKKRIEIAKYYHKRLSGKKDVKLPLMVDGAIYLRFNILTNGFQQLFIAAKKEKIILGNWYRNIIDPKNADFEKIGYTIGSCPNAEIMAKLSVNLPTYYRLSKQDLDKITDIL